MKITFSRLEWVGAALLLAGPVLYFAANHMSLREMRQAPDPRYAFLEVMSELGKPYVARDSDARMITSTINATTARISEVTREASREGQLHHSRAYSWAYGRNAGFSLFLLGIAIFLIGGRRRSIAAMAAGTTSGTGVHPPVGPATTTPGEGRETE